MPKPPFGPHVDAVQKRETILALSQRILELAGRIDESDECDPETLALITQMEQTMAATKTPRIEKDNDDDVVNAQLPKEEGR